MGTRRDIVLSRGSDRGRPIDGQKVQICEAPLAIERGLRRACHPLDNVDTSMGPPRESVDESISAHGRDSGRSIPLPNRHGLQAEIRWFESDAALTISIVVSRGIGDPRDKSVPAIGRDAARLTDALQVLGAAMFPAVVNEPSVPTVVPEDRWMSIREAARYLGLSQDTVRSMVSAGEIPSSRARRRVLLRKSHLDEALARSTQGPVGRGAGQHLSDPRAQAKAILDAGGELRSRRPRQTKSPAGN